MAVYTEEDHLTRPAGVDLTAKQYFIVKLNASKQLVLASAATDFLFGVVAGLPDSSAVGTPVDVAVRNGSGTFKVVAGGTIAVGDLITSDANGNAVTTVTSGNEVLGVAVEAAVAGQVFEYLKMARKV